MEFDYTGLQEQNSPHVSAEERNRPELLPAAHIADLFTPFDSTTDAGKASLHRAHHFLKWTGWWDKLSTDTQEGRPRSNAVYLAEQRPEWLTAWRIVTSKGETDGL